MVVGGVVKNRCAGVVFAVGRMREVNVVRVVYVVMVTVIGMLGGRVRNAS